MENHFLTTRYYLKGTFFSLMDKIMGRKNLHKELTLKGYELIKWLKIQDSESLTSVGLFNSKKHGKVIIKCLRYSSHNMAYEQIINEKNILKKLSKLNSVFPKVYEEIKAKGLVGFVYEFKKGRSLSTFSSERKTEVVRKCLNLMQELSQNIQINRSLPKRTSVMTLLTFSVYISMVTLRDLRNINKYISWTLKFYSNYLGFFKINPKYVLSHRDLHSENIIVSGKSFSIVDPEIAAFAEEGTDLAISAKSLARELGVKHLSTLMEGFIKTKEQEAKFRALSIYYAVQMMAIRESNDPDYIEASDYLSIYLPELLNRSTNNTLVSAEIFEKFGLNFVFILNKLIPEFFKKINRPIILCYHAVNNGGWRFSIPLAQFEKQMKYLKDHHQVVSLDMITSGKAKSGDVAITFDDGYLDTYQNASKILRKYNLPASLFVLGDSKMANRNELDNQEKLLSLEQIKKMHSMGWEIGFHSRTHSDLRTYSSSQLDLEIMDSKKDLEKELGFKMKYFAYPRGLYNKNIIKAVKRAGFKTAFTVDGGLYNQSDPKLLKDRISLEKVIGNSEFQALLTPLGIKFMKFFMNTLKLKEALQHQFLISIAGIRKGEVV